MSSSPYSTPPESSIAPEIQYAPPTSGRPTGVTVFAILHFLFGITGILGTLLSVAMFFVGSELGNNPIVEMMNDSLAYRIFTGIFSVLGLVFSVLLIVSGIGLLSMSKTARTISLVYAVYAIFAVIVSNAVNVVFVFMPILEQAAGQGGASQVVMVASIAGGIAGGCVGLIYPVAILIYFLRPSVKQQFESWETTSVA